MFLLHGMNKFPPFYANINQWKTRKGQEGTAENGDAYVYRGISSKNFTFSCHGYGRSSVPDGSRCSRRSTHTPRLEPPLPHQFLRLGLNDRGLQSMAQSVV